LIVAVVELFAAGYDVREEGEGERILPAAITQESTLTSSGAFEPLAPESTKANYSLGHRASPTLRLHDHINRVRRTQLLCL
jgi:hypothetical protein